MGGRVGSPNAPHGSSSSRVSPQPTATELGPLESAGALPNPSACMIETTGLISGCNIQVTSGYVLRVDRPQTPPLPQRARCHPLLRRLQLYEERPRVSVAVCLLEEDRACPSTCHSRRCARGHASVGVSYPPAIVSLQPTSHPPASRNSN